MTAQTPKWIIGVCIFQASLLIIAGLLAWSAPHLLFASEGYRTVARGIIGIAGALAIGLGAGLLTSSIRANIGELIGSLRVAVIAYFGIPAVVFFNLGAVEPLRETFGVNVFILIGLSLALFLAPAALALFHLQRTRDAQATQSA